MNTKKDCAKQLGIYLLTVFTFMMLYILCIKPMDQSNTLYYIIYMIFSFSPAIATLITRAVTKEGFRDMKLHLKLVGNFKWYLLAFALPLICFSAKFLLPVVLSGHADWLDGYTGRNILSGLFSLAAMSSLMSIGLIGEELGWRGYMNQKIEPLLGTVGTCIVGGIVWGLWHLPMDIAGCEGTFSDAFAMCGRRMIHLTLFGVFLMWLTKKTDSIFPAVIGHYIFNESQGALAGILYQGNIPKNADLGVIADVFEYVPMILPAAVFMIMLLSDKSRFSKNA